MSRNCSDLITRDPKCSAASDTVDRAAQKMRDKDIGWRATSGMGVSLLCLFAMAQVSFAQGSLTIVPGEIKVLSVNFADTGGNFDIGFDAASGNINFSLEYSGRSGSGSFRIVPPPSPTGLNLGNIIRLQPPGTFTVKAPQTGNINVRTTISRSPASADLGCLEISLDEYPCVLSTLDIESATNRAYIDSQLLISNGSFPNVNRTVNVRVYFGLGGDGCPASGLLTRGGFAPRADCPCVAVLIDHLEVVQVVQTAANEIPLVAGKPAVARLFLKLADPPQQPVSGIRAVLRGSRDGTELPDSPLNPWNAGGGFTVQNVMRREQIDHSLNFELPAAWLAEGTLSLRAEVKVPACPSGSGTRLEDLSTNLPAEFYKFLSSDRSSFRVAWVPVCYQSATNCPQEPDIAQYDYLMRNLFPLAPDTITYDRLNIPPLPPYDQPLEDGLFGNFSRHFRTGRFKSYLRRLKMTGEARWYDQLLGILPDISGSSLAGTSEKPGEVAIIVQKGTLPSSSKLSDPSHPIHYNANSVAHEIAHNYRLEHTNNKVCTLVNKSSDDKDVFTSWPYSTADVQEVGFDVPARQVIPPDWGDLMSYCSNEGVPEGMSPHTYTRLMVTRFDLRPPRLFSQDVPAQAKQRAAATPQAIVTGWARKDGTEAAIDPIYQVISQDEPPASSNNGTHCLEFSSAAGALSKFCFDLSFIEPEFGDEMEAQPFAFKIPLPGGATKLSLTSGGAELSALSAASGPIALAITSPAAGDRWTGGTQTIAWTGSAPDALPLTYTVQYSPDGGQSWLPMALDIKATQYTFDPASIEGGPNVHFRVIASAGLSSATAAIGPVDVQQAAALRASASEIDFGSVAASAATERALSIANTGTGPLTLTALAIDHAAFRLSGVSAPLTIPAGAERPVTIRFAPGGDDPAAGTLRISSNDLAQPTVDVTLRGNGGAGAAAVSLSPASLDFGSVPVSQSKDLALTLQNSAAGAVTVTAVASSNAQFQLVSPAPPFNVAAGASQNLVVRFTPAGAATVAATLTLSTNHPAQASVTASLAGVGVAAPQTASFAGLWNTTYGPMILEVSGNRVTGSYFGGTITGTVEGLVLDGQWSESSGSGTLRFTLAPDGNSFTGIWTRTQGSGNAGGTWNGTRIQSTATSAELIKRENIRKR